MQLYYLVLGAYDHDQQRNSARWSGMIEIGLNHDVRAVVDAHYM
jgi:hypothetical protein